MTENNYKSVQITEDDKADLDRIYKKAGKFRSTLMHEAIEYLKRKYKVKDEDNGDDFLKAYYGAYGLPYENKKGE